MIKEKGHTWEDGMSLLTSLSKEFQLIENGEAPARYVWMNEAARVFLCYCEGDLNKNTCESGEEMIAYVEELRTFYGKLLLPTSWVPANATPEQRQHAKALLVREMQEDIGDYPYAVTSQNGDEICIEQKGIVIGTVPLQYQTKNTWNITSRQEWIELRDKLMPLSDLMEAREIYASDPNSPTFRSLFKQMTTLLARRGIKYYQGEEEEE